MSCHYQLINRGAPFRLCEKVPVPLSLILAFVLILALSSQDSQAQVERNFSPILRAVFFPEPKANADIRAEVPPPSFEGKVIVRGPDGIWQDARRPGLSPPPAGGDGGIAGPPTPGVDVFLFFRCKARVVVDPSSLRLAVADHNIPATIELIRNELGLVGDLAAL